MDFEELIITAKQLVEAHLSLSIGGAVLFAMFIFLALVKWRQDRRLQTVSQLSERLTHPPEIDVAPENSQVARFLIETSETPLENNQQ
ncbi:MAG: hypothetical protein ACN4FJ_06825 [Parvibaculales bacterium]